MKKLNHYLDEFIAERITETENETLKQSRVYEQTTNRIEELQNQIKNILPPEERYLMEELEEISNNEVSIMKEELYRQGFIDGIGVTKMIYQSPPSSGPRVQVHLKVSKVIN